MASSSQRPRVDRSQAILLFWGLVSLLFATGACFYFVKSREDETRANRLRDELTVLQSTNDSLISEKQKLQSGNADTETQYQEREKLLQEKQDRLADQEKQLAALSQKPAAPPQTDAIRKYLTALHALPQLKDAEVAARDGHQVLRLPNTLFFEAGETGLTPEGKALLNQIVQALKGANGIDLRLECYTDAGAGTAKTAVADAPAPTKSRSAPWDLTSGRVAAMTKVLRDQTALPPQNVFIVARGDLFPLPGPKEARSRRVEISLVAAPVPDPLAPPPDSSAPTTGN